MDTHIYTMLFLPGEYNVNDAVFHYKLNPPPKKRPLTGRCVLPTKKGGDMVVCFLFLILKSNFVI